MEDGSVVVRVNGRRWVLDPSCVVPAPGEQPEDELSMQAFSIHTTIKVPAVTIC